MVLYTIVWVNGLVHVVRQADKTETVAVYRFVADALREFPFACNLTDEE